MAYKAWSTGPESNFKTNYRLINNVGITLINYWLSTNKTQYIIQIQCMHSIVSSNYMNQYKQAKTWRKYIMLVMEKVEP